MSDKLCSDNHGEVTSVQQKLTYFVSDVHLGLQVADPDDRELRFAAFLRSLPAETASLYLLGDIWDFWYEYKHVVPKGYLRVLSALQELVDRGVDVFFFQGNHDVWTYSYFEELGIKKLVQPTVVDVCGKKFCLGHGDGLGPVPFGYRFLRGLFHNRVAQFLFSFLHPWLAFSLGNGWSKNNRLAHDKEYVFAGAQEPLFKFAEKFSSENEVDYFVFGHYHADVRMKTSSGSDFVILKDWIKSSPFAVFDGCSLTVKEYNR